MKLQPLVVLASLPTLMLGATALAASPKPEFEVAKYDIKGDGGTDYVSVDAATGRVFVSRASHVMVVEGASGKVLVDIPDTPGVHGTGIAPKARHGFTTNSGNETVTMFDLKTLAALRQIKVGPGLDGITYDAPDDRIILTNHSRPVGTLTALDPASGDIVATVELGDPTPEGAVADGKGRIYVNLEGKGSIEVVDVKTWKSAAIWSIAPCERPTGIAYDKASNRLFAGCSGNSVVVDAATGKVVAAIASGMRGVDAVGWDAARRLMFIPNGGDGTVTVVHQDSPDKYSIVAEVPTFAGAKTLTVDPRTHNVYQFQPERGPPPAGAPVPPPSPDGRIRTAQGPILASWFIAIRPKT